MWTWVGRGRQARPPRPAGSCRRTSRARSRSRSAGRRRPGRGSTSRGREEHEARELDHERPQVDPHRAAYQRHDHDMPARTMSIVSIVCAGPSDARARHERAGEGRGDQPQHEDAADRGRRAGSRETSAIRANGAHPVAERGDTLTDEQRPKALAPQQVLHAASPSLSSSRRRRYTRPARALSTADCRQGASPPSAPRCRRR